MRIDIDEKTRAALEKEIEELENEKASLKDDKPLIWNIEFSEIFSDKGGFDIVIGNPPYVRQEDISDPKGIIKEAKEYKNELLELVRLDFFSDVKEKDFKKVVGADAKSDLYIYFYFRGLRLLNKKGIHTYICSNSWLDVGYGAWLQEFLLDKTKIHFIIDNHAKRSFDEADVNTIISVIEAPFQKSDDHFVKFVAFKKPFEETLYTENLIKIEEAKEVTKTDEFRVYPIKTSELRESGTEYEEDDENKIGGKFTGDKWGGKYLRAPEIFFTLLNKGNGKIIELGHCAEVLPGCYSGVNDFFYIDRQTVNEFGIESDYLVPIIRNSKQVEKLLIDSNSSSYVLGIGPVVKIDLKKGVFNYINWGEKQVTRKRQKTDSGIPWPKVESVKNRKFWYSIPKKNLMGAEIFMQYVSNDRFYCPFSKDKFVSDRCFHRIFYYDKDIKWKLAVTLNSTIQAFFVMLLGRSGLGMGALKFEAKDAAKVYIISPESLKLNEKEAINIVGKVGKRKPESLFIECGIDPKSEIPIEKQDPNPLPDRAELDKVVFDALNLTEEERKEVYRATCQLVWNRISKAKSMKK